MIRFLRQIPRSGSRAHYCSQPLSWLFPFALSAPPPNHLPAATATATCVTGIKSREELKSAQGVSIPPASAQGRSALHETLIPSIQSNTTLAADASLPPSSPGEVAWWPWQMKRFTLTDTVHQQPWSQLSRSLPISPFYDGEMTSPSGEIFRVDTEAQPA